LNIRFLIRLAGFPTDLLSDRVHISSQVPFVGRNLTVGPDGENAMSMRSEELLKQFVEWCRQTMAKNQAQIASLSKPGAGFYSYSQEQPQQNIAAEWIRQLEEWNTDLQNVIDAYDLRGPDFPNQLQI
jgi:hypothetical protein